MNRFEETKVRMVMKLKKLTHRAAVKEIARMAAEKRKAAEEEEACAAARQARLEAKREELRRRRAMSANIGRSDGDAITTADFCFE